jgi:hypothetical protein
MIERQLAMLKSDYEILKMSPVKAENAEYRPIRNNREDVQTSI